MRKNIHFIFGASGFVGSHLINKINKKHIIFAFDKKPIRLKKKNLFFFKTDLSKLGKINTLLLSIFKKYKIKKINCFWQLAANSDIKSGSESGTIDLRDTFLTTYNSTEVLLRNNIEVDKYIFSSTSAVYGDYQLKFSEKSETKPISNYGAMKMASEACLSAYCNTSNTKTYIIRFPNVIGKNMTHGLIFDLVKKNYNNPNALPILGNGNQQKQYMTVNCLLDSIFYILKKSKEKYSVYNIASEDSGIKVSDIVNYFIKINKLKTKPYFEKKDYGWVGDVPRFKFDVKKLKKLGWYFGENSLRAIKWTIKNTKLKT
tara:strand:+ start:315 stop:1262 length:948 start_codon:yes stop_codon:yes gene_type:complete